MPVRTHNPYIPRDPKADLVKKVLRGNSLDNSAVVRKERSRAEADYQAQIERLARANGWYPLHIAAPQTRIEAGCPDLVLIRERVVWVELKARSTTTNRRGKLAPEQEAWRDMLKLAGQEWFCWFNDSAEDSEEAKRVLAR